VSEPQKPKNWASWIDQQIRSAQEQGAFDDLPGRGQPLDLTPNPYAADQELAFKILKDAGYAPEWIELDKAIRAKLDRSRRELGRRWTWRNARLDELAGKSDRWAGAERERVQDSWHSAVDAFGREVADINRDVADLNLKVPSTLFQRHTVDAAAEVGRLKDQENG
jgi:DnaJ family protein C protein 28